MNATDEAIRSAALALKAAIDDRGIAGSVGYGGGELFVYLTRFYDRKKLPDEFQGFHVRSEVVGRVRPL